MRVSNFRTMICALCALLPWLADAAAPVDHVIPKTIIELQPFRRTETAALVAGPKQGKAALLNLNPGVNAWFLLTLDWGGAGQVMYHLENSDPAGQEVHLSEIQPVDIVISSGGRVVRCAVLSDKPDALERARASSLPYAPLCNGRLYLRNAVAGHQTELERVTDFLRDHVWKGDEIVGFVRDKFYQDAFRETADARPSSTPADAPQSADVPLPAVLDPEFSGKAVAPKELGISVAGPAAHPMVLGRWYPARDLNGIYVSVVQAGAIGELRSSVRIAKPDPVEASSLDYLVAFDMSQFEPGFVLGTDHPRLGWSPRVADPERDNTRGPDGIADSVPLARTGMISPAVLDRVVAAFTGGFKREHGAFKYGELAKKNHGSHYGFVEQGVVFSRLQPGLATVFGLDDGSIQMKTWSEDDNRLLSRIRFARQNGVALVERDATTGEIEPGKFVGNWGLGNWSGSADEKLRTLRAGACLQESGNKRFLVYGYFSTATPSAMASVFLSYRCRYAMLLDINALEHTYLALYRRQGDTLAVEHLIPGMAQVDKTAGGKLIPRFVGFPDNRDFFYIIRRRSSP